MNEARPFHRWAISSIYQSRWVHAIWLFGVVCIGLKFAINLLLRDRVPILSVAYYAIPPVALAVASALLAWLGGKIGRSRRMVASLQLLAVSSTLLWLRSDIRLSENHDRQPNSIRIVVWNIGRGRYARTDQIAEHLGQFHADVIALVEATGENMQSGRYWRQRLPDYRPVVMNSGLVLLVRGEATRRASGSLTNWGEYRRVEVAVRESCFDVILADVVSTPWISRRPALQDLWQVMCEQKERPTIVVGDFNTPPESVCFDTWRTEWARAWDAAGIGYQPTWPQPFPLLTLDHVWGNCWVSFDHCEGGWSNCSDHRPVIVDFTVTPTAQLAPSERTTER